jgi:bacterial/archaeal transporter family protein
MKAIIGAWQFWAFLAAIFAALTAILAKLGVDQVNADFATFFRTIVVAVVLAALLTALGEWQPLGSISARGFTFLTLSGLATGASWLCYFRALKLGNAAQVAPIDKLSVVFVAIIAAAFLGEQLSWPAWIGVGLIGAGAVIVAVN